MSKKFLKEYFNFSKREQNGLFVLFLILLLLIAANVFMSVSNKAAKEDFSNFETEIDSFLVYQQTHFDDSELFYFDPNSASREDFLRLGLSPKSVNAIMNYRERGFAFYKTEDLLRVRTLKPEEYEVIKDYVVIEKKVRKRNYSQYFHNQQSKNTVERFDFDPNTATKEDFINLGLKSWQAENIEKYRSKGGVFSQPSDFAKIYGLDKKDVEELLPYIYIDEKFLNNSVNKLTNKIVVKLNSSTDADLQQLAGIGPAYAKRIIDYGKKLGGYTEIHQLTEVYGMTNELYESIKNNFVLDTVKIRQININKATFKDLIAHPYIDKKITNAILNYRDFAKKIKSVDELVTEKVITKEEYNKISKYISVK